MLRLIQVCALAVVTILTARPAWAGARVEFCFNYGCVTQASATFEEPELVAVRDVLVGAVDAASERAAVARAVAMMYRAAGTRTPISADRAGNLSDNGAHGRMDCIDHSTNTTRLLHLFESRGWLRYHRVKAPERRRRVIFQHFSAVIEERDVVAAPALVPDAPLPDHVPVLLALCDCEAVSGEPGFAAARAAVAQAMPGARYVVDSWFVEQGEPAVVLPLADWLNGEGPNVE